MHKRSFASTEVLAEELLPGILNDITLDLIVPKLSWRHSHILSSVSRTWQHAIQSHAVYDARVQSRSTETLAVVGNCRMDGRTTIRTIALYSTRDKTLSELPPIPDLDGDGRPGFCKCVSSHGKLYVLGGKRFPSGGHFSPGSNVYMLDRDGKTVEVLEPYPSSEVYVLDLAGQRQWRRCAKMNHPRVHFGSAAIHGKIYVFGGQSCSTGPLEGGEIFDPKVNAWSPIAPMPSVLVDHEVSVIGEELFMSGGHTYKEDPNGGKKGKNIVYNPINDKWRWNGPSDVIESPRALAAQGKFHLTADFDPFVHDIGNSRSVHQQLPLTCPYDLDFANSAHLMTTIQL